MINTKTKGELGRRIEYDVEHNLFHPQNIYSDEYITPTFVEYVQKLEKENAELKDYRLTTLAKQQTEMSKYALNLEHKLGWYDTQLTKAKEIIKAFLDSSDLNIKHKAEEFLGEF